MTDETLDPRFERDLRAVLAASEPADAPASLYASVAEVPTRTRSRRGWVPARMAFTGLAMAAVVLVALAALALALRPWGDQPIVGGPTASPANPSPVAGEGLVLTYEVMPAGGKQPGPKDIETVIAVLQARIAGSLGTASSISSAGTDGIIVRVAMDTTDEAAVSDLRQLLGTTGHLDFVPLGDTPASQGDSLDLVANPPLFSGDQVAGAKVGADQSGGRTVDFTLRPDGARLFGDYTAAHIGTYFAIALDGVVISAPAINSSIPNGEVQISQGGEGGYPLAAARSLVQILQSGELPFPIVETSSTVEPDASGGPAQVTPVPSELILRTATPEPSPSDDPVTAALIASARAYAVAAGIAIQGDGAPVVSVSSPDFDGAIMRQVTLQLDATDPAELRVWFDDIGRIAAISDGRADAGLEGPDVDQAAAIEAAAEQFRLAGVDPGTGTLTVAGGGPGTDWYVTLDRSIVGHPVANAVMSWRITGDHAYVTLRRDGALRELYAIRPSHAPAPQVLGADALDGGLATLSALSAEELAALHPALAWVRAVDAESGVPAPLLTLGYCATQVRTDGSWNGWCVDAGTGERSVTGGGVD